MQLPNIDQEMAVRLVVYVLFAGLIILGVTVLLPLVLPLVGVAIVLFILYLLYRYFTTGSISF